MRRDRRPLQSQRLGRERRTPPCQTSVVLLVLSPASFSGALAEKLCLEHLGARPVPVLDGPLNSPLDCLGLGLGAGVGHDAAALPGLVGLLQVLQGSSDAVTAPHFPLVSPTDGDARLLVRAAVAASAEFHAGHVSSPRGLEGLAALLLDAHGASPHALDAGHSLVHDKVKGSLVATAPASVGVAVA